VNPETNTAMTRPALTAFGHYVKRLRIDADLTQEALAERSGLSSRLISDVERGTTHRPRRTTIELLANGLALQGRDRETFLNIARGRQEVETGSGDAGFQLLAQPDELIGRTADVAAVRAIVLDPEVRLLTLTGPGGVGKTRLSIEVGNAVSEAFPDGVRLIELAPVRNPALVLPAIARGLGVQPRGNQPLAARLATAIHRKRMLLILDNMEQVVSAACELVELLKECADLVIVATSRTVLNVRGERIYRVQPLALPALHELPSLDVLMGIPSVTLLRKRAAAVAPGFDLTAENARAVAAITHRLDGLPLAIELAAARLNVLTPAEMLERLEPSLPLLTGGPRDLPERLQTLRSAIDWSYQLLWPDERQLFCRLAVFSGGFTLDAAEAVSAGSDRPDVQLPEQSSFPTVLDGLSSLVENSLVQLRGGHGSDHRFWMLETIREFALDQLAAAGDQETARARHAEWCLAFAEQANAGLYGADQSLWLHRMDAEHDNIRAALTWALERQHAELGTRLAGACAYFWQLHGHLQEARSRMDQILSLPGPVSPSARARALLGLGVIALAQGDYARAMVLEDALETYQAERDNAGIALALRQIGNAERAQGRLREADALQEEALAISRALGDMVQISATLRNLGLGAYDEGDYNRAKALLEEAMQIGMTLGERLNFGSICNNLALVSLACGEIARAAELQLTAMEHWRRFNYEDGIGSCFENLALIAVAQREYTYAATMFGAAEEVKTRIGSPGRVIDLQTNQIKIDETRTQLGEASFQEAWHAGRSMRFEEALDLARRVPAPRETPMGAVLGMR
jgi:predicted ATPase